MEVTPHDDGDIDWSRKKKKARRTPARDGSVTDQEADHACKGLDTHLARRDAITFVECESCQCARGLTQTQRGYVAQVGRRKRA